jgi:formate dehydrogenase major subunit
MAEGRTFRPVIDHNVCGACGACACGCPAETIREYREEADSLRGALYSGTERPPKMRAPDARYTAPCSEACPAGVEADRYVGLVGRGKFREALDLIMDALPFPGTMGLICTRPCEDACLRGRCVDEPVAICALKSFVAASGAQGRGAGPVAPSGAKKAGRVAVVGGGPSGITCALYLKKKGYDVTVFEATDKLGGMLYWAVPAFRLPRNVIEGETALVRQAGIEVRFGVKVGRDISMKDLRNDYDAVYVACGAQAGAGLGLKHADAKGVLRGVEFLLRANMGKKVKVGEKVAVIGGGNVAIDAARMALRLGAKEVTIVYRRTRQEMPAAVEEIEEAENEKIKIRYLLAPTRIVTAEGKVTGVECRKMTLGERDESGRARPVPVPGSEIVLMADTVISAIGQEARTDFLRGLEGLDLERAGWVKADPATLETGVPGLFAGGDVVGGPATAIDAIADGKKAAVSIDRYLSAEGLTGGKKRRSAARGRDRDAREV